MTLITRSGIYETLDIERYHEQCTEGISLSSSSLRAILPEIGGCPAKFWAHSSLNPKRVPFETSDALDFGRASHALVLGEPEFVKKFVISPWDDFNTKASQQWRDDQDRQVIKEADFTRIVDMASAIKRSSQTRGVFTKGKPEVSLFWKMDESDKIFLKSRPDWLPDDVTKRFTLEYKTAVSIEPGKLSLQSFKLGYEMQAYITLEVIKRVTEMTPLGIAHVCQEKKPPYLASLMMFTAEQIEVGRTRTRKALNLFAECWQKHISGAPAEEAWPGYTTEPSFFETPQWVINQQNVEDDEDEHEDRSQYLAAL